MEKVVGEFCMRISWATVFREIVKVTLFFAAGAALVVGMLQFQ
jgi:hypothetical protein